MESQGSYRYSNQMADVGMTRTDSVQTAPIPNPQSPIPQRSIFSPLTPRTQPMSVLTPAIKCYFYQSRCTAGRDSDRDFE